MTTFDSQHDSAVVLDSEGNRIALHSNADA
jgi:predicted enzyme related to lactoylglutathione lyase